MRGTRFFNGWRACLVAAMMILGFGTATGSASGAINYDGQQTMDGAAGNSFDDIATGPDGTVYLLRSRSRRVLRYAPDGTRLESWSVASKFPSDLATDPEGNVLVTASSRIERFGPEGERLRTWNLEGKVKNGLFDSVEAGGIAVAPSGVVYLTDRLNFSVVRLSAEGKYLGSFGGLGTDTGQFVLPGEIAVGSDGRVYVVEDFSHQVQVFGPSGRFIRRWGREGFGPGEFQGADTIATDRLGHVYVGDAVLERVQVFDENGTYLDQRGSQGTINNRFHIIESIAASDSGIFYVLDRRGKRVQRFRFDPEAPHNPQAQLYFELRDFMTSAPPGKRITARLSVVSFGDLPAQNVRVCPVRDHRFTGKVFGRAKCRFIDEIEPGRRVSFRMRGRVPRRQKAEEFKIVSFNLRSGNAGNGDFFGFVFTGRLPADFFDDLSAPLSGRGEAQSVAMRLRARGAPGT